MDVDEGFEDELGPEDEADILEEEEELEAGQTKGKKIPDEERASVPFLTKYEKARILGTRALQISKNADLLVDAGGETDPYKIAELELREGKIPFVVRRYMPDGSYEDWKLAELTVE